MHNGDSGVALEQQHGGRHAHNVGAPQHYRVLALDLHPAAVQQLDAPLGRTEHGQSCGKDGQGTLQCHRERRDKVARVDTSPHTTCPQLVYEPGAVTGTDTDSSDSTGSK